LAFLIDDNLPLCQAIGEGDYAEIIRVLPGPSYEALSSGDFIINPARAEDYRRLFSFLNETGKVPAAVLHLWNCEDLKVWEEGLDNSPAEGMVPIFNPGVALLWVWRVQRLAQIHISVAMLSN